LTSYKLGPRLGPRFALAGVQRRSWSGHPLDIGTTA
jgi:hypothetical protein